MSFPDVFMYFSSLCLFYLLSVQWLIDAFLIRYEIFFSNDVPCRVLSVTETRSYGVLITCYMEILNRLLLSFLICSIMRR